MPRKYHIRAVPTAGRFRRVGKYGCVDAREDCSRCTNCVKLRCVYDTYRKESAHNRDPATSIQSLYECRACLSCVQGCTKGLLTLSLNPEFLGLGDEYWTPDILDTTWKQADTGRIPVSGAGYRGRFHGPGFDSIWTDMSEIVRPTRDGIHGREYISTSVDVGPKPMRLSFRSTGELVTEPFELIELPVPLLLDLPPWEMTGSSSHARLRAASMLGTLAVLPASELPDTPAAELPFAVPLLRDLGAGRNLPAPVRMVEIADGPLALSLAKQIPPPRIVALRLALGSSTGSRMLEAVRAGVKVFHLCADLHGRQVGVARPRHLKDALRELHGALVQAGVRDEVTLIAGGGIALAEHVAKTIICGADLVAMDTAPLVALGCRVCRGAKQHGAQDHCPAQVGFDHVDYAAQRIVNLVGAWHSQLIEVLGAMGIREVRRLRGEVGRAIFQEDIEKEAFGDLARQRA